MAQKVTRGDLEHVLQHVFGNGFELDHSNGGWCIEAKEGDGVRTVSPRLGPADLMLWMRAVQAYKDETWRQMNAALDRAGV